MKLKQKKKDSEGLTDCPKLLVSVENSLRGARKYGKYMVPIGEVGINADTVRAIDERSIIQLQARTLPYERGSIESKKPETAIKFLKPSE